MSVLALPFPMIDPVAFEIGPLVVRWYALAYIAGLFGAMYLMKWMVKKPPALMTGPQIDDFLLWALLGTVLGGRLGYVIFYKPLYYLNNPVEILQTWTGGMSFHGGLIGVTLAMILYARRIGVDKWALSDLVSCTVPIGIGLGRIANFINGELYGRPSDVPWAMVFPGAGPEPRHPSQLYEAALEGLVLIVVLHILWRNEAIRCKPGILTGVFCAGYGVSRFVVEFFRTPDAHLGLLAAGATMGQLLSLPLILFGVWAIWRAKKQQPV